MYVGRYVCIYVCRYVGMLYVCMDAWMDVCMYACMYVCALTDVGCFVAVPPSYLRRPLLLCYWNPFWYMHKELMLRYMTRLLLYTRRQLMQR